MRNRPVLAVGLAAGTLIVLLGCATVGLHPAFTAERVLGLQVGLTTDSVVSLFGPPDRTEVSTCGSKTPSPWQCLVWEYDMGRNSKGRYPESSNTNRLMFSMESSPPHLNNWTIDLMYGKQ